MNEVPQEQRWSRLMTKLIREYFPNGLPGEEQIHSMTPEEKEILFNLQRALILSFRSESQAEMERMREELAQLKGIEKELQNKQPPPSMRNIRLTKLTNSRFAKLSVQQKAKSTSNIPRGGAILIRPRFNKRRL